MRIIAHRGISGSNPENTLLSFTKTIELGINSVELDVHATRDGSLVVIHDKTLDRTTNGNGPVIEKTLNELKTLNAGGGQQIPTLQEVLNLFDKKTLINIEIKGENTLDLLVKIITDYVETKKLSYDNFFISSFDQQQLVNFKKLLPQIKLGVLIRKDTIFSWEEILKLKPYSINHSMEAVTVEFIKKAHNYGLKVFVYTVNELEDMIRMQNLGVDGIFSDYPERAVDIKSQHIQSN
jgi:glycerophosphoryl diester phosphodiesterase